MKVVSTNKVNRLWNKGVLEKLKLKINATDIVNNFTTTVAGKVADARALKTLKDELDQLNGKTDQIIPAIGLGTDIINGEGKQILGIDASTLGRWTYYNANSDSEGLPPGEVWGFALHIGLLSSKIYIVIYISGSSGKMYHATYNGTWSAWNEH